MNRKTIARLLEKYVTRHYGARFHYYYKTFPKRTTATAEGNAVWTTTVGIVPPAGATTMVKFSFIFYANGSVKTIAKEE